MGKRAATSDYSLTATGYYIMDMVLNYQTDRYQVSLTIENLLNRKWKEAQFATTSRLPGEKTPITDIDFTPGTHYFIN